MHALRVVVAASLCLPLAACQPAPREEGGVKTEAVYNRESGRLQELKADMDGDGKNDAVAYMEGTRLQRIELDRDNDGKVDRWEYYDPGTAAAPGTGNPFDRWAVIARAEESGMAGGQILRREFYTKGQVDRVEEDSDANGRVDKWEFYSNGVMARIELDLLGKGFPNRRLVYGADGSVVRIEGDDEGRGVFAPLPASH